MKVKYLLGAYLAGALSVFAAETKEPGAESEITAVTIYADRALITREAPIQTRKGFQKVVLRRLPAWIDTSSLRAHSEPRSAADIVDVELKKEHLARADNAELRQAALDVEAMTDRLNELDDQLNLVKARQAQVEALSRFSTETLPRDAVTRDIPVQRYKEMVEFSGSERAAIVSRQRELEKKKRALQPEAQALQRRLNELRRLAKLEHYDVILTLQGKTEAQAKLVVRYMLPGATWDPVHEMHVETDDTVRFTSYARISQTTGEDWSDADVAVSTQSPGRAMSIPKLEALLVGSGSVRSLLPAASKEETFTAANRYFNDNNVWMNAANQAFDIDEADYLGNVKEQTTRQKKSSVAFARLQQRGTTAIFTSRERKAVRSDGRPVRLLIGNQELERAPRIVAAPEISLNATRTVNLTNTGQQPILPGTVALYLEGAFIGSTEVDFVGLGEEFSMFAGLASHIKLSRVLDHKKSSMTRGRRTNKIRASFVITVEDSSDEEEALRLADRIPVSDDKEIRVSGVKTDPGVVPDSDGLLLWNLVIPARSRKVVTLDYAVEYPANMRENLKSASSVSALQDATFQIMELEARF